MQAFPIFLRLQDRRVLVVGAGQAADSKQRLLEGAGARVERSENRLPESSLSRFALIFGASGNEALDRAVAEAACASGVPVNVVDRPELSDFIMPAVVDRGEVVIGISTGGGSPILAQRVRAWIEDALPQGVDRLAAFARRFRKVVQDRISDNPTRRRFWERFFDGEGAALVMGGDDAGAARQMIRDINSAKADAAPAGSVTVLDLLSHDADDLTLKALRALRRADVIAHDASVPAAILDYARRDARRIALDVDLAAEQARGARVVVLRSRVDARRMGGAL